jgi:hypothetical protein
MTIHLALTIRLNKKFNEFKALSDKKCDNLIKNHDQLHLLVIDDISLVGNRMLSFIDYKLQIIKQVHNQFMGGIDVIMTSDFCQACLFEIHGFFHPKTLELIFWQQIFGMEMSNVTNYTKS